MQLIFRDGACVDRGLSDLFFSSEPAEQGAAQGICAECPVRRACLAHALDQEVEWGVWGGVVFWDGAAFHRRRGRGRPRKDDSGLPIEATRRELRRLARLA